VNPHYPPVADRAGHRCEYCRAPEAVFNFPFEVEHILPASKGGSDEPDNLALACRACNLRKSNIVLAVDPETHETVPLFHPRTQVWVEHFEVTDSPDAMLRGKTATGRATIIQLQMNAPRQLAARQQWIALGLFGGTS
jgi:hypothetical protein